MTEQKWVTEKKVSEITGRALPTLRNDRCKGKGIRYSKIGRSVRYLMADVIQFMESRRVETEDRD
jgi:phage terminase Nu1 subunit (DNA packaging protein)